MRTSPTGRVHGRSGRSPSSRRTPVRGHELLPATYEVLGLAKPDPSASIHTDEEAIFERFLDVWRATPDLDSMTRAARLMAQGARAVMLGWTELTDEQLAEPARQRLLHGGLERFLDDVRVPSGS
jgi:hypothetical protein